MTRVYVRPSVKTRKRRRRRRAISLVVYIAIVFLLAWYFDSQSTTTVIFVRHADVNDAIANDSAAELNAIGRQRAELLAEFLESIDVVQGVDAIYVSPATRTLQTAEPLAERLSVEPTEADHTDVVGFMKDVLRDHNREIVLVVTEGEMIAPLVEELHGSKNIAEFAADEYDKIFIVTIPRWGKVKTLQLRYGIGWSPVAH